MFSDFLLLLFFATSTLLLQFLGFPFLLNWLKKSAPQPEWWAWGRIIGWLVMGLTIWFTAHLGLPINNTVGFWAVFVFWLVAVYYFFPWKSLQSMKKFVRTYRQQIFMQEMLFLTGFLFLGLIRTFNPMVLDLEKFMNIGLMQGYLRSPTLPAIDMWLAGEIINYYSFGHFLGSLLLRFWHVSAEFGFNLLAGWMMGLILMEAYVLIQTLLRNFISIKNKLSWSLAIAGLMGALLIVFGGNSHPIWYWLTNRSFTGYWYPEAVRFINFTIHEIPAYSFVVSDLHAHFWSIPLVLFTIFVAWQWAQTIFDLKIVKSKKLIKNSSLIINNLILGGMLGVLGMTNTWDMMIYGLFLIILGSMMMVASKKTFWVIVMASWQVIAGALIAIAPWWLNFYSIVKGVFWVSGRSPLWQLAVLWSGHVLLSLIAIIMVGFLLKKQPKLKSSTIFILSLGLISLICILLPEVIYFKDIYPTFQRANTMFKFTFQGFILMNLLIGWLIGFLMQKQTWLGIIWRGILLAIIGLFFLLVMNYPFLSYPNYYQQFRKRQSLNGLTWLANANPAEYQAILWLRNQTEGRPVVLEAVGESYSVFARVSAFSGLPTVIGWRAHEWLWRGGPEIPTERSRDVQWIYEKPLSLQASYFLDKHQVRYIFIGNKEREAYKFDLKEVLTLGEIVFQQGSVIILERTR
ncbi:MAG: hypothetical protein ACD_72C00045G0002 [uncultured bacterium]|nr:MAG: hypothetical protein ACD_72C00045G0002 [uncultured bacterium]OGJ38366.1 MAG: hypothetical protein A2182_04120 [Candidatus Pacebacteria bacterium RIFOXYA1_FULL_38_18]OGJ38551.1 MAG: hypothetical protein A2383_03865 [Candidatus Pacebacteria bacterium RIFOXYB1_FULL_39_46]OGJ40411.1 MAG: hypothetical protein A2411_04005 [Candidatus Pacebacteria bacterium RIFOXYC1_FULL_39_21]OGJ40530.1 MAG: hypothetical protein A2582_02750 [Candidatus Pacebacteria bacterium RIFOXYD1_FULL_39_27]